MINKLISIIVGILMFLFGQLNGELHLGVIGGMNSADLDPYVDGLSKKAESKKVICGGLLLDIDLSEYFVLRAEPMYIPKGGIIVDALQSVEDAEMEIKCSYLELPVFIRTNHENSLNLYLLGGPVISYLLDCKTEIKIDAAAIDPQATGSIKLTGDLMDSTKKLDIGFGLGFGFKIPANKVNLYAEMRYVRGLTNSRKTGNLEITGEFQGQELTESVLLDEEDNRYANQGLQLLLGFTF